MDHQGRGRAGASRASKYPKYPGHIHSIQSILDILEHDDYTNLPKIPLKDEGVLRSIVTHLKTSESNLCPSPPDHSRLKVTRRRTYKRKRSPSPNSIMERRDSTWSSTIKSYLANKISKSQSREQRLTTLCEQASAQVPQTEKELDKYLLSVWGNVLSGPSIDVDDEAAIEIEDLKYFYDRKLRELKQNYKVDLSELSHLASTSCTAHEDQELTEAVSEAKVKAKCFDRLRFALKEQMAKTILEILPESLMFGKRLSPWAVSVMTQWFKRHLHHPYPTAEQKEDLATKSAITVEQVSTWFSRKRATTPFKRSGVKRKGRSQRRRRILCGKGKRRGKGKRGKAKGKGKKNKGKERLVVRHIRRRQIGFI